MDLENRHERKVMDGQNDVSSVYKVRLVVLERVCG